MKFIGWTPTVTGRLSFSAVGDAGGQGDETTCNFTAFSPACLFTVGKRVSRDGPIPNWLLPLRIAKADFVGFLDVDEGLLPFPSKHPVELKTDRRGVLRGTVIVLLVGRDQPDFSAQLENIRKIATTAANPNKTAADHQNDSNSARSEIDSLWTALVNTFNNNPRLAPAFAKAQVTLARSGQTDIEIQPSDLYLTFPSREAQLEKTFGTDHEAFQPAATIAARQIFHFVRDLAHRHYHHSPRSDLATTTYVAEQNDIRWRRETHYGLLRMAISSRRRDDIISYKQAQGILAYAETFQSQLAPWSVDENGQPKEREDFFPYDFQAFRLSIEARLRLLEAQSANGRATLTFILATMLSTLAVIVSSSNFFRPEKGICAANSWCGSGSLFWSIDRWIIENPLVTLSFVLSLTLSIAVFVERFHIEFLQSFKNGFARFLDGLMGFLAPTHVRVAWTAALGFSLLLMLVNLLLATTFIEISRWAFDEWNSISHQILQSPPSHLSQP